MNFKETVLNYIKTHDVPYYLKEDIEDRLQKCTLDNEVYELILRIHHRLNIANCPERGIRNHVPAYFAEELASYNILTILNKKRSNYGKIQSR